jgi:hypothetical protein
VKAAGIVLIVVVGLLNFHIPHFLIQSPASDFASVLLELVFVINVIAAAVAAVGIYRNGRWAWFPGLAVVGLSILLYLLQETVGLPGLPRAWLEPSRLVSLLVELVFAALAVSQLARRPGPTPGQPGGGVAGSRSPES